MAGAQAHGVQTLHDGGGGQPGGVLLKDIPDCLGTCGLDDVVLVGVHGEAQRAGAAQGLALEQIPACHGGLFRPARRCNTQPELPSGLNDDASAPEMLLSAA